ncbi:6-phosphogluconolactonase [Spirochaetia bacterium 38H-sp]|uniref:6-phosphogluconolactonase n=1 Tax=Rarispira pelagica TaxID=3141764 RepID=A0ABU9UE72_9SPIR
MEHTISEETRFVNALLLYLSTIIAYNKDMETITITKNTSPIASWITDKINNLQEKDKITILLPGGRSIIPVLKELKKTALPWKKLHFFLADERCVPQDHPDSNYKALREHFFLSLIEEGKIAQGNIHPYTHIQDTPHTALENYIKDFCAICDKPDISILGAGEDGHIASLFPHHPSIMDDSPYYISVTDAPKPPPIRISASKTLLESSTYCLVLFLGEAKREALRRFLSPDTTVRDCPAKLCLQTDNPAIATDQTDILQ